MNQPSHHDDGISVSSSSSADDNNPSIAIPTWTNTSDYPCNITVRPQPSTQDSLTYESFHSLPFLPRGKTDMLPKYSGKASEDINEFAYKLRIFLSDPSIDNCQREKTTNSTNHQKSIHLARLLDLCISGDALSPFINNLQFQDKGIEMFHHLHRAKYPISASTASNTLNAMFTTKILQKESLEAYSKRLRNMYCVCTENGTTYQEDFLVRCFIQGLDSYYDATRELLKNGSLDRYSLDLTTIK